MSITTDTTTEQVAGSVEFIDPQVLEFEDNVRDHVELDRDFLDSLRELGVIVPILAVRDADGRTYVREGQCRTLGAREVGLTSVPVYLLPAGVTDEDTATVKRIVQQMVANDKRKGLKDSQRARAIQQMLDTGMSATKVAKKLSMPRNTVKAAGAAAKSEAALSALEDGQLDFTQAEVLAEFEDDENAVERLLRAASYNASNFEHTAATLRSERAVEEMFATAEKDFGGRGYTVLQDRPSWRDLAAVSLDNLQTVDGQEVPEDFEMKPEHWAVFLVEAEILVDAQTGEPVDDDDVDRRTRWNSNVEPAEGLRHFSTVTEKTVVEPDWYCLDYAAAGLALEPSHQAAVENRGGATADVTEGEETPEAIAEREAAEQEAERRERRKTLTLNRLGEAAESVRRDYVTKLLARKTAPKGAATFVAHCLTRDSYILTQNQASNITAELLGVKDDRGVRAMVNEFSTNIDARAQVISLAVVLGALEARTHKSSWRNARTGITGTASYIGSTVGADAYLQFLIDTGYQPSEVEKVIVGQRTSEGVFLENCT